MSWYVLRTIAGDYLGEVPVPTCGNDSRRGLPAPGRLMNALVFASREEAQSESGRVLQATGIQSDPVQLQINIEDRGREARLVLHTEGQPLAVTRIQATENRRCTRRLPGRSGNDLPR